MVNTIALTIQTKSNAKKFRELPLRRPQIYLTQTVQVTQLTLTLFGTKQFVLYSLLFSSNFLLFFSSVFFFV